MPADQYVYVYQRDRQRAIVQALDEVRRRGFEPVQVIDVRQLEVDWQYSEWLVIVRVAEGAKVH
jgi:hypothetical protein